MEEWKAAARRLEMSQTPNPEEDEDYRGVHESIKLSYDYLRGDDAKRSFLLCCLFPEDDDIPIADLMKYGLGIGLFRDVMDTIANARVRANSVAKHLKESSLLLDGKKEGCIRMHDVIRDTAISIASSEGFLVKAGCKLKVWPSIIPEGFSAISLMRNRIHELPPEELVCSKLQILLLVGNSLCEIPEIFFHGQQNALRVLDVSWNRISSLPTSLSFLVNLQGLYLDYCLYRVDISILKNLKKLEILSMRGLDLKELPKEIGHLANLRILDVTDGHVDTVPSEVISRLSRLEELYLQCNFQFFLVRQYDQAALAEEDLRFDELIDLEYLTILKVNILGVDCLPKYIGSYPNWVEFNISFCDKSWAAHFYHQDLFSDEYSRTLTLDTTITTLPAWFIEAVAKKTEKLQYVEAKGLTDIVVEHDHGGLQCLKYLSLIGTHKEVPELMKTTTRRITPNEPLFENLEGLYVFFSGLKELCVGELPNGSLRSLKLLKVKCCYQMVNAVVPWNLLQRLRNLDTLICEEMVELEYVFGTDGLVPEQIVSATLRYMILKNLWKLIKIWDGPAPRAIFGNLNFLAVSVCKKLKTLLTSEVAECLLQLELLRVDWCQDLERVIELPSGETETNKVLVLPKLKSIVLVDLPRLTGFYSSTTGSSTIDHIECPSLEHLYVKDCPQFSTSVSDFHSRNQVLFRHYEQFVSERWLPSFSGCGFKEVRSSVRWWKLTENRN